jgi:ketopantoate reductase
MRVAIVGAGALGTVYAVHLACHGACEVDLVARRPAPKTIVRVIRVGDGDTIEWLSSERVDHVPRTADVIIACVRYDQLDTIIDRVASSAAPVVVMTPMMPQDHAHLSTALPGRVVAAMPGVIAYESGPGTFRYWLPRQATTLIDARSPGGAERELAVRLESAGIRTRLEPGVLGRNVATTVSFVPIAMAIDAGGGIDALLADRTLLALAVDAADEGRTLARSLGEAEAWASMLLRFVRPFVLRVGVGLARSRLPEAVTYVENHFGRKLHTQNVLMAQRIIELATRQETPRAALERLLARLLAAPAAHPA